LEEERAEARCARHWLAPALAVLIFAGLFSLVVVIGRMPPFDRLVTDPLFFKRGLVVHVNLALVAWFYSFIAALLFAVSGRAAACFRESAPAAVGAPPAFRRTFHFTGWQRAGRRSPRGYARQRDVSKRRGE